VNKDIQKEFVLEACFFLIAVFKRGSLRGVVENFIMQRNNASKPLFIILFLF
jgi:hypothetical protein